jgi:hypothetical protein
MGRLYWVDMGLWERCRGVIFYCGIGAGGYMRLRERCIRIIWGCERGIEGSCGAVGDVWCSQLWERYIGVIWRCGRGVMGSDWVVGEVHLGHTGLWERCRL